MTKRVLLCCPFSLESIKLWTTFFTFWEWWSTSDSWQLWAAVVFALLLSIISLFSVDPYLSQVTFFFCGGGIFCFVVDITCITLAGVTVDLPLPDKIVSSFEEERKKSVSLERKRCLHWLVCASVCFYHHHRLTLYELVCCCCYCLVHHSLSLSNERVLTDWLAGYHYFGRLIREVCFSAVKGCPRFMATQWCVSVFDGANEGMSLPVIVFTSSF